MKVKRRSPLPLSHTYLRTEKLAPYGIGNAECDPPCDPLLPRQAIRVCVTRPKKPGKQLRGPEDVCRVLRNSLAADRESFFVLHLDAKNRIVGAEETARGGLTSVELSPREVFKAAILTNAASILLAHNHPSGEPELSHEDRELTRKLVAAGKLLGIPIRDHVVIASDGCVSMHETHPAELK